MEVRVANFNAENLFSRYAILNLEPEIRAKLEAEEYKTLSLTDKTRKYQEWHQIKRETIDDIAQQNTAKVISAVNADIICLQEVEDLPTLRNFEKDILYPIQKKYHYKRYKYLLLIDGNDGRGIDVAIMSRYPIGKIRTNMFEMDKTGWPLFSRDCLEVEVLVKKVKLNFLIQHFKSQISRPGDYKGRKKRKRQAFGVAKILKQRIDEAKEKVEENEDDEDEKKENYFIVAGDLNANPSCESLEPLLQSDDFELYNVINELPKNQRWTYLYGRKKNQYDYLLASEDLVSKIQKVRVERRGISRSRTAYKGRRFKTVQKDGTEASDHCAIWMDLEF